MNFVHLMLNDMHYQYAQFNDLLNHMMCMINLAYCFILMYSLKNHYHPFVSLLIYQMFIYGCLQEHVAIGLFEQIYLHFTLPLFLIHSKDSWSLRHLCNRIFWMQQNDILYFLLMKLLTFFYQISFFKK